MPRWPSQAQTDENGQAAPSKAKKKDDLGVEDLNLPKSMVHRLAKGVIPLNTSIQKDALLAISKSATVFVNYLASDANNRASLNNKKTIQPADVYDALRELEFEDFQERVKSELETYNAVQCEKRNNYRRRVREEKDEGDTSMVTDQTLNSFDSPTKSRAEKQGAGNGEDADGAINGDSKDETSPPAAKKQRTSYGNSQRRSGAGTENGDNEEHDDEDEDEDEGADGGGEDDDEEEDDDGEEEEDEDGSEEEEEGQRDDMEDDVDDDNDNGEHLRLDDDDDDEGSESD